MQRIYPSLKSTTIPTDCTINTADFIQKVLGVYTVHSLNRDYVSIPEGTGSLGYLFHEIPGTTANMQIIT